MAGAFEFDNGRGLVTVKEDGTVAVLAFEPGTRSIGASVQFTADEWRAIKALTPRPPEPTPKRSKPEAKAPEKADNE